MIVLMIYLGYKRMWACSVFVHCVWNQGTTSVSSKESVCKHQSWWWP